MAQQLIEHFKGKRKVFTIPLVTRGSELQQEVWQELLKIPYGSTRPYMDQAKALRKPDAIRAIVHANSMNRISVII